MECPTCRKPAPPENNPYRPFCSERCKMLDFGHWVDEDYRVPSQEERPSVEELEQQISDDGAQH